MLSSRTFHLGYHIWFVLHYGADGKMRALEEHTWREGGHLSPPVHDETWEKMFVHHATRFASGDDYKAKVKAAAEAFLVSNDVEVRV